MILWKLSYLKNIGQKGAKIHILERSQHWLAKIAKLSSYLLHVGNYTELSLTESVTTH